MGYWSNPDSAPAVTLDEVPPACWAPAPTSSMIADEDLGVAVPCSHCGRQYDVALFPFGRTISCTCGHRVGIEPRVRSAERSGHERFLADAMLARLAKWLRLFGLDCDHRPQSSDAELVRLAVTDDRILLTRDRGLAEEWWIPNIYLVKAEDLRQQLVEVIRHFDLASSVRVLSRCTKCNHIVSRAAPADVSGRVPPRILETHDVFWECRECGRVYWEGSHAARIRALAETLVAAAT